MLRRPCVPILLSALLLAPVVADDIGGREIKKAGLLSKKANRAVGTGKVEQAIELFNQALAEVPAFPDAEIGLGKIAMSQKRFDDALGHFRNARDGFIKIGAPLADMQTRRYADAQRQIRGMRDQINNLAQNSSAPQVNLQISRLENAISQLEAVEPPTATGIEEPPAEIDFYIGNALFQMGEVNDAAAAWERCRDRSPDFALVYNNLALAYWRQGRLNRAIESLDRAEELGFPVNPQFRADLDAAAASR